MSPDTDQNRAPRSPIIRWLHNNATWLGALGAIAAILALFIPLLQQPENKPPISTGVIL